MQLLFDFLPVIAFFVTYKLADIYLATGVLIIAVVVQSVVHWVWKRRLSSMHLVSAGLVLVFGGLTLLIHDKAFIMWKPTIVNWLFAAAFLASQWPRFGGRPLVERLMNTADTEIHLPDASWRQLNMMWVAFFLCLGVVNLVVFRYFDEDTWVNFKLFGMLGLTVAFIVAQGFWLAARSHRTEVSE